MKDKPKIIGLCGPARVGKDTLAGVLVDLEWRRVAFADALKSDVLRMLIQAYQRLGLPYAHRPTYSWLNAPERKEVLRPLLVEYGRAMRSIDPLYWVNRAERDYMTDVDSPGGHYYVVTDVRYDNECTWIRRNGGVTVGLTRTGYGPANEEEHVSLGRVNPDFTFCNEGQVGESRLNFRNFLVREGIISLDTPVHRRL